MKNTLLNPLALFEEAGVKTMEQLAFVQALQGDNWLSVREIRAAFPKFEDDLKQFLQKNDGVGAGVRWKLKDEVAAAMDIQDLPQWGADPIVMKHYVIRVPAVGMIFAKAYISGDSFRYESMETGEWFNDPQDIYGPVE